MKSFQKSLIFLLITFFSINNLFSQNLESLLKQDFTAQQTIQIKFFVNKRLYSFEAGKHKIQDVNRNKKRVWEITKKIVPWAIFEGLKPDEVARIIVYMYHAERAGASFLDSEDLIPLVATRDIPLKDFLLMVQYNRETKRANISEPVRQLFLSSAMDKGFDGTSILTGGRGLMLAKSSNMDVNKVANILLKRIPPKGTQASSKELISSVKKSLKFSKKTQKIPRADYLLQNLSNLHNLLNTVPDSPKQLKQIMKTTKKVDSQTKKIAKIKRPRRPRETREMKREKGLIPDLHKPSKIIKKGWKTLKRSLLMKVIGNWLGTPYRYGGKGRGGIDCSGFTRIVFIDKRIGVPTGQMGHGTRSQRNAGHAVSKRNLRTGDLVFFSASTRRNKITHVGIVTGKGTFSHSCRHGVIHDKLTRRHWSSRYVRSRRLFGNVIE